MADWGPVAVGVILFLFLQPGLLMQIPGSKSFVEFSTMKTSGKAILVHALIFFAFYSLLTMVVHIQVYPGKSKPR